MPLETKYRLAGWVFELEPPVEISPDYRRVINGNVMYYHGCVEVRGSVVRGCPTQYVTPDLSKHMETLVRVFALIENNPAVWEPLPGGGGRVSYIFGYDRSRELVLDHEAG